MNREQAIKLPTYRRRMSRRAFFREVHDTLVGDWRTLPNTILESTLFTALVRAPVMGATEGLSLNSMAESAGILSDNDSLCVMSKQENLSQLIAAGPVREEFATRLLPGILLAKNWRVGVFSSTAFAYMHQLRGIQTDRHGISIDIDFAKLPTGHFIAGLYYWKVFKDRGLLHSIAAHATTNTLAAISGWIHCPTENPSNRVEN